ncbi:MAG: hypothetical protein V5A68_01945, partial [Candidatus Thermoplasmatota archaeon]
MSSKIRRCVDCGKDISNLHHNAKRCKRCAKLRKKRKDRKRHLKKRIQKLKWDSFIEDTKTGELTHRSAKGSKIRYWLDKICKKLTSQELDVLLNIWDRRIKNLDSKKDKKTEFKTCAGIVRYWRDYNILNSQIDGLSYESNAG